MRVWGLETNAYQNGTSWLDHNRILIRIFSDILISWILTLEIITWMYIKYPDQRDYIEIIWFYSMLNLIIKYVNQRLKSSPRPQGSAQNWIYYQ